MSPARRRRSALFALALLLPSALAVAQHGLPRRQIGLEWRDGVPRVHFHVRDLAADPAVRRSLTSGIARKMTVTAQAFRTGSNRPIATAQLRCTVTYDLFARSFLVRRGRRTLTAADIDEVLESCLVFPRVPIGEAASYRPHAGRPIFFAVRAEFNPIDRRRCRQLLRSSGSGDQDPIGPIVINIVRREICEAERVVEFRTATTVVPGAP
ncbi:MAG TPA: hypothetical protein RMH85_12665 [Polyangiaceae bacterium LLY-WYZ-15_(1-7)]|nr:hypothetical protein [Myxococcales bacterium]MAT29727.1 hypothetical protein [Sandaracinus sp.]HJL05000.1 hypothetical protein [Polyangiaceae bacterium LLY-WYZ-15_(1-7)]MBJ75333.1 hypothetical protein [Sandaracinus sp.]HJL09350.1 hypothetical protein [Polyangiaceae bacterium LLY-WYZ-15_(1-7)]